MLISRKKYENKSRDTGPLKCKQDKCIFFSVQSFGSNEGFVELVIAASSFLQVSLKQTRSDNSTIPCQPL